MTAKSRASMGAAPVQRPSPTAFDGNRMKTQGWYPMHRSEAPSDVKKPTIIYGPRPVAAASASPSPIAASAAPPQNLANSEPVVTSANVAVPRAASARKQRTERVAETKLLKRKKTPSPETVPSKSKSDAVPPPKNAKPAAAKTKTTQAAEGEGNVNVQPKDSSARKDLLDVLCSALFLFTFSSQMR